MAKKIYNLLIVDESGSMCSIERQALDGINETLQTIRASQKKYEQMEQVVNLLLFDSNHQTFVYDNTPAADAMPLKASEYNPGGCTPLYDAIGKGIAKVNALTTDEDNVLVTIITDGYENSSHEYTLSMVKNLIEKLKKQGWTFTFIGTDDLDVEGMAKSMGIGDHLCFKRAPEETKAMFRFSHQARDEYMKRRANNEAEEEGSFFKNPFKKGKK